MKPVLCSFLLSMLVLPAASQHVVTPDRTYNVDDPHDGDAVVHGTFLLTHSERGRAAIEDFHRRKAAGQLPYLAKTLSALAVGDTVSFKVYNYASSGYDQKRFVWKAEGTISNVWVEVSEATGPGGNGHVTEANIQALVDAMELTTPAGSFNPNAGILANNIAIFGDGSAATSLPNVDGDGKTDLFLHDIIDAGVPGGGFIAGFVDPSDLSAIGNGNNRDILHLDSNEGLLFRSFDDFLATAAHELQHLIHINYSSSEESFVNEGLSEFAEVANGYQGRRMRYLADPRELRLSLFSWQGRNLDYERAGLLTNYIAERTDVLTAGSITRDPATGRQGYENAASSKGLDFKQVLADFHTATLLNGSGLSNESRFFFQAPTYANEKVTVDVAAIVDGNTFDSTVRRDTVKSGSVLYRVWTDVEDFTLTAATIVEAGQTPALTRGRAALRAIVERPGGTVEILDLDVEPQSFVFQGKVDRLTLLFVHTQPVSSSAIGVSKGDRLIYDYTAEWSGGGFAVESTQYDNGQPDLFLGIPNSQHFTTRFSIDEPDRTTLDVASIAIYYSNQFGGGPADTEPRDFTFEIRAENNGSPGALLYSEVIADPRPNADVFQGDALRFLDIDLSNKDIPDLPSAIYIGASNAGSDANTIVTGIARYNVENVSYLSGNGGATWRAMWDVALSSGDSLTGKMSAVRLQVLVGAQPVAVEDTPELPAEIELAQNFPNPFNPSTTIRYALPSAADVTLSVYDILGREMVTLSKGVQPSGSHEVTLDASRWASGMYIYVLDSGGKRLTRQMVLLK